MSAPPGSLAHALAQGPLSRAPLAGTTLGAFVVEGELGRGAMGIVLRALDRRTGVVAALKVLMAGAEASETERRRFVREAELARAVAHPAVVPVLDAGDEHGLVFIAYELVEGVTLAKAFELRPPAAQVLAWMAAVARGVGAAHARGIVHRDLKPHNVLVRERDLQPLVTDFGLARDLGMGSSLTRTGGAVGTPAYMAPEQAKGKLASAASDVFALGEMLYEGLCGRLPFSAANPAQRYAQIMAKAPPPPSSLAPGLPAGVDAIVLRCLRPKPEDRYADAAALADALAPYDAAPVSSTSVVQAGTPARPPLVPIALVALAALALAGAVVVRLALAPDGEELVVIAPPPPLPPDPAPIAPPPIAPPPTPPPLAAPSPAELAAQAEAARHAIRAATAPEERRRLIRAFVRAHADHPDARALRAEVRGWRQPEQVTGAAGPGRRDGMERALVWDPVGRRVLLFAGWDGHTSFDDLWAWDGLAWKALDVAGPRPPARFAHSAAWDEARGRLVVFGGCGPRGRLDDTWTWDGARWNEERPDGKPTGRAWQSMVWDPARQVVVMYGMDLWTWDGSAWIPGVAARGPVAREALGMAWDPARRRFLVFGGFGGGRRLADLWSLDGESWTQLFPPGPAPEPRQAPVAWHDGERLYVFGGHGGPDGGRTLGDTWAFDGERWQELDLTPRPSPRTWTGASFDPARRAGVIYGGCLEGTLGRTDEVWELGE